MIGIYKITSPSGKIYIGQSWNIEGRFSTYRNVLCPEQSALYNSLKKYGSQNHIFEIVKEFTEDIHQDILDNHERFYISQLIEGGVQMLNIRDGGSRGKYINGFSEDHKRRISERRKGTKSSEEAKAKISKSLLGNQRTLGFKPSLETRAKLSEKSRGHKRKLGVKHTEETRRKMVASKVGYIIPPEDRIKMKEGMRGKKKTYKNGVNPKKGVKRPGLAKKMTGAKIIGGKRRYQAVVSYSFGHLN